VKKNAKIIVVILIALSLGIFGSLFKEEIGKAITGFLSKEAKKIAKQEEIMAAAQFPYVSGEIIVKFKPYLGKEINQLMIQKQKFQTITGNSYLDNVNTQFQVKSMERVFKALDRKIEEQKLTPKQIHQGVQEKFPQRAKRAPKNLPLPDIENIYLIKFPEELNILKAVAAYSRSPEVIYAQPNYVYQLMEVPNDPYYSSSGSWSQDYPDMWGLHQIQTAQAWDIEKGSEEVTVAVLDTGVDYEHEDLRDNIWINQKEIPDNGIDDDGNGYIDDIRGWNFSDNNSDVQDRMGHGTHCAGTIAAATNNGIGVAGISWNSKIMILNAYALSTTHLVNGFHYAADNGADIISNSWGFMLPIPSDPVMEEAIDYAYGSGLVVVFAAGNNSDDVDNYALSNYPKTIAVAASDHFDRLSPFSNFGTTIDVAAPGGDWSDQDGPEGRFLGRNILSLKAGGLDIYGAATDLCCVVGEKYYRARGTSMACPHVAGLAALVLSKHPEFTNEQVRQVIRVSADDIEAPGWDEKVGYGRINAYQALLQGSVCAAKILSPKVNEIFSASHIIKGIATCPEFQSYKLEYGLGINPSEWHLITESTAPVENGSLGTWDVASLLSSDDIIQVVYTLRLKVLDKEAHAFEDRVKMKIQRLPYQSGWPVRLPDNDFVEQSSPVVVDINDDGNLDVLIAGKTHIYAFNKSGTKILDINLTERYGSQREIFLLESTLSIADLDPNSSGKEILAMTANYGFFNPTLHIFRADGTEVTEGWPKSVSQSYYIFSSSPVIADIDLDGRKEIIHAGSARINSEINIWDFRGNPLDGWPKSFVSTGNPSIGQLDSDPELEIVVGDINGNVHIFNHDGSYAPARGLISLPRVENCENRVEIVLVDVDLDGIDEIVATLTISSSWGCPLEKVGERSFYILDNQGNIRNGWPYKLEGGSSNFIPFALPAIGDINGDGLPEIIVSSDGEIYCLNRDDQLLWSWPALFLLPNPIIGNFTNHEGLEILATSFLPAQASLWKSNGELIAQIPLRSSFGMMFNTAAVVDLDKDGDMELIAIADNSLEVFDLPNKVSTFSAWPQFRQNPHHTGRYPGLSCKTTFTLCQVSFGGVCSDSRYNFKVDFNKDGRINITDFSILKTNANNLSWCQEQLDSTWNPCLCSDLQTQLKVSMSGTCGQPNYNFKVDFNKDGRINITDFSLLRTEISQQNSAWCQAQLDSADNPCPVGEF